MAWAPYIKSPRNFSVPIQTPFGNGFVINNSRGLNSIWEMRLLVGDLRSMCRNAQGSILFFSSLGTLAKWDVGSSNAMLCSALYFTLSGCKKEKKRSSARALSIRTWIQGGMGFQLDIWPSFLLLSCPFYRYKGGKKDEGVIDDDVGREREKKKGRRKEQANEPE